MKQTAPDLCSGEVEGSCNKVVLPGKTRRVRQAELHPAPSACHAQGGWVHLHWQESIEDIYWNESPLPKWMNFRRKNSERSLSSFWSVSWNSFWDVEASFTSSTQTMRALVAATMCPVEFLVTPPSIEEKSREKPNQGLKCFLQFRFCDTSNSGDGEFQKLRLLSYILKANKLAESVFFPPKKCRKHLIYAGTKVFDKILNVSKVQTSECMVALPTLEPVHPLDHLLDGHCLDRCLIEPPHLQQAWLGRISVSLWHFSLTVTHFSFRVVTRLQ